MHVFMDEKLSISAIKTVFIALLIILTMTTTFPAFAFDPLDNWAQITPAPTAKRLYNITYSNNSHIVVGNEGTILTSVEGTSWMQKTSDTTANLSGVAYGDGVYIIVDWNGNFYKSMDANTWTFQTNYNKWLSNVTYGKGKFVAVGLSIFTSTDGTTINESTPTTTYNLSGTGFFNDTFFAVGDGIFTSADGATWDQQSTGSHFRGIAYGNGVYVAVGWDSSRNANVYTSLNGTNWTKSTQGLTGLKALNRVAFGQGNFVAVGDNGAIITSPDGISWVSRPSGTTVHLLGIVFNNTNFVAVAANGAILLSAATIDPNIGAFFPSSADFDSVVLGSSAAPASFTFTNNSQTNLKMGVASLTGVDAKNFQIVSNECEGKTLNPSATCSIKINFWPTSEGTKNALLSIMSVAGKLNVANVSLAGQAVVDFLLRWEPSTIATNIPFLNDNTISLRLDSSNKVHMTYIRDNSLQYLTNKDGAWSDTILGTLGSSLSDMLETSLAIDKTDRVNACYSWAYSQGSNGIVCYAQSSGGWQKMDWTYSSSSGPMSLAIDGNDKLRLAYINAYGDLDYATNQSGDWTFKTVAEGRIMVGYFNYASIAVDIDNNAHIAYIIGYHSPSLKYAVVDSAGTIIPYPNMSWTTVGSFPSISVDSQKKAHVSYYDYDQGNRRLKYANNATATGSWDVKVIDESSNTGMNNSIAVDHNDNIHIAYYDDGVKRLKYATNKSGIWETVVLDSSDDVGRANSIAIDSNNFAHIGYYDLTNGAIKYIYSYQDFPSLSISQVAAPLVNRNIAISGTTDLGSIVSVSVNNGSASQATVAGTDWRFDISDLLLGENTIMVTAGNVLGKTTVRTASIFVNTDAISPMCIMDISPSTASYPAGGGTWSVQVSANDTSCSWSATSKANWITLSSGTTGSGNGAVNYSFAANGKRVARVGTLTIAGRTLTVTQSAPLRGDIDNDGVVTLADMIIALQTINGIGMVPQSVNNGASINSDGRIGLSESIYIPQKVAGLRTAEPNIIRDTCNQSEQTADGGCTIQVYSWRYGTVQSVTQLTYIENIGGAGVIDVSVSAGGYTENKQFTVDAGARYLLSSSIPIREGFGSFFKSPLDITISLPRFSYTDSTTSTSKACLYPNTKYNCYYDFQATGMPSSSLVLN